MADNVTSPPSRDRNAMIEETQPAALRLLSDKALGALLRDLRAMKAAEPDIAMQKVIAQAIRRAADEKHGRTPSAAAAPAAAPAREAEIPERKLSKAERNELKRRKQAEREEKQRVKQAERAERKAEKAAARERLKADRLALKEASLPAAKKAKAKKAKQPKAGKPQ